MANKYAWGRRKDVKRPPLLKGCLSKTRYLTEHSALKSAQRQKERRDRDLEPYSCGLCKAFHLRTKR